MLIGIAGIAGIVVLGLLVGVVVWFIITYNVLVGLRNKTREAWAQIDVQLKRRHDLIPNLVETVKGYAGHEHQTLEAVIAARGAAVAAKGPAESAVAERGLSGALGRLMVLTESYPNLKADANFTALQEELTSTENKIGFARQFYNEQVMIYNTRVETIPTNIAAGVGGFKLADFFELEAGAAERQAPQVKF